MKQRRIILSVTNDLVTDQRVHRSCTALSEAGYDVTLVGRRLPDSVPVERPYKTVRMRLLFRKKAVFYAEYNLRLFLRLLFSPTDAFYANDTDSLPANYLAAVLRRKPLFFDAHEMFPEVPELVGRPRVKRFWTRIEDRIFPRLIRPHRAAVTVCQSIADIYRKRYGLNMRVVRNVPMSFPKYNDAASQILASLPQDKRILLYQGAVNVGRGIEWIMAAMPYLPECHLVIAGVGDTYLQLKAEAAKQGLKNVTFLGRVEPATLHGLTATASLGLSLLENRGLNYYYSLPNRIADFVQSEVPVLATDFPEIRRVVKTYGIGTLVEPAPFDVATPHSTPPDPQRMAQIIRDTLVEWDALNPDERHHRFALAAADLTWENDKKTLLSQVDTIF
ncbi:MAG: glycosyltransferase [Bacteroidales bacterium]|nr:glycosyltransferase [Bacteroidales bacterium]